MIREQIESIIASAVAGLMESGELPAVDVPAFEVERPQVATHGDYAANVALKLAATLRAAGQSAFNPRALAEAIAARIRETVAVVPAYDLVAGVEVAGPGFINLRLTPEWLLARAVEAVAAGNTWGCIELGRGRRVNLEFVSANPTGPVTIGNGRGAFIGDTLGNVMRAAGYDVTKEYYFNDAGGQIDRLGRSVEYYMRQAHGETEAERPEEGYFGPYYAAVAEALLARNAGDLLALPADARAAALGGAAAAHIMADIRQTMERMHIEFDVWFNQAQLEASGAIAESIKELRPLGFVEEREGATWARTTAFGDDKDRVIIRSSGDPTYFASDVAYMRNKFSRGFNWLIFVLGPDHHGYIGRLKATAGVLGHALDDVYVLMYQQVNLKAGGKTAKMGKRLGNVITLDELYEEIGSDVTRFFFLMRANDTHLDFDLDLARKQTDENPGLSVQYAHARAASVLRKALDQGIVESQYLAADVRLLAQDSPEEQRYELELARQLLRLEEVVERVATSLEPHHLARYAMDLADAFHLFYDNCPILKHGADVPTDVRMARLRLLRAALAGLARTLTLIGMSAPQRMERSEALDVTN